MSLLSSLNSAQNFLNQNNPLTADQRAQFTSDGFLLPQAYNADGNGLPYSQVPTNAPSQPRRNIITWFVPQIGMAKMFINPNNITYTYNKLISQVPTKGGYTLQYWGEKLTEITIAGTTGSSGIEGINMLYEIYRSEQLSFDGVGLTLAASNASADLATKGIGLLGNEIGGATGAVAEGLLGGILGVDSPNNNALAAKNITSLAQLAFTIEMYYNGWVHRGYFSSMTVNERADNFLFDYNMHFVSTQRRGYRTNYFPWSHSPASGPSQTNSPMSFDLNNIKSVVSSMKPNDDTPMDKLNNFIHTTLKVQQGINAVDF